MSDSGLTPGDSPRDDVFGEPPIVSTGAMVAPAVPAVADENPDGSQEDMFARAVGLAEPPKRRQRRGRQRRAGSRPIITPDDAARIASSSGNQIPPLPGGALPGDPTIDGGPRSQSWIVRRRGRVRRTRRTIRHIDPWSVFKVSLLLYACLYVAAVIAGVLLWSAAVGSGFVDNIESFVEEVGSFESWELNADEIFRSGTIIGLVLMVAGVAFNVLLAILFNLISDLVGGVRVTILEEDTLRSPTV